MEKPGKRLWGNQNRVKSPHNIPMSIYIQEAEDLHYWALQDKEALTAAGLDAKYLDELPNLCETATVAEREWYVQLNSVTKGVLEWEKQAPPAFELRKQLLHHFRFAFRGYPHLVKTLNHISGGGKSYAKQIQDLNDLAVLGRANLRLLEAIPFDKSLLEKAAQASYDLSMVLADAIRDRMRPSNAKEIRDLAYTRLKEAVDEIRFYGRYVFRGNKERLIGYRSEHIRQMKTRRARERKKKGENAKVRKSENLPLDKSLAVP
ncbi:MAG: hypothetical protein QG657_699 [Acidobacteriota bacterium]|nr:hypothetical protein [Acidobacteriota bacterium]